MFNKEDFAIVTGGRKNYNFGWLGEDIAKEHFRLLSHKFRPFEITGNTSLASRKMFLWLATRKCLGKDTDNYRQEIGDCVSFGCKNAQEYLSAVQIVIQGKNEKWRPCFPPYNYGTGRVFIGKGQIDGEDGSTGAWMAAAVQQYGTLFSDEEGVPKYSGGVAKKWGDTPGPDKKFVELGKKYLVKSAAQIKSWNDLVEAICNGYPCTVASNQGFSMAPGSDGFHNAEGQWNHQMCATPYTIITCIKPKIIKDIKIGDKVIDKNGKEQIVTEIYTRPYKGKILKIKSHGNQPLEVTGNHPVLVYRDSDEFLEEETSGGLLIKTVKRIKKWINADQVKIGDYLVCPKSQIQKSGELPKWITQNKCKNTPKDLFFDDDIAWMFGLYAADGSAEKGHKIVITLHENEIEKAKRCVEAFLKLGLKATITPVKDKKAIRVKIYSSIVADSFLQWFNKKENKQLPEWIFNGWNLEEVLDGIYAGDGGLTHDGDGKRVVNTSRILIEQVRTILLNFNFNPSITPHEYKDHPTWNTRYIIQWHPSKKTKYNYWENNELFMEVYKIEEEDYDGLVYNLEVENSHSYIANGVVVHNCIVGVDDEYKDKYAIILNSWGDVMGKLKDFYDGSDLPVGCIRAHKSVIESMINQEETFAYSNFDGFPGQNEILNRELFDLV